MLAVFQIFWNIRKQGESALAYLWWMAEKFSRPRNLNYQGLQHKLLSHYWDSL